MSMIAGWNSGGSVRTGISDVKQHGDEHVVHQVQSDAVGKQGVPDHQQVLQGELSAEQQANPAAVGRAGGGTRR